MKIFAKGSNIITAESSMEQTIKDNTCFILLNMPIFNMDLSLLMLKEWNNCDKLSTAKAIVRPKVKESGEPPRSYRYPSMKAVKAKEPIRRPSNRILNTSPFANIPVLGEIGLLFIMSLLAGSTPRDIAGKESVTKFTHKSCTASNGDGKPNNIAANMVRISPILLDNRK